MYCKLVELETHRSVTNAAGALNPEYTVGDVVVLNDVGHLRYISTILTF